MVALVQGLGGERGFGENILSRNDDGSTAAVDITSVFDDGLNFFGTQVTEIFINNNGSITFNSPRSTFTPDAITAVSGNPEITPYFADVDTRMSGVGPDEPADISPTPGGNSSGSNLVYYDLDPQADQLTITWDDVGFFSSNTSKLNAFQLILTDVEGSGNFDMEFRYEDVNWTTGNASGGQDGLGGTVARAGWTAGTGNPQQFFELPQSGDESSMLQLDQSPGNTGQAGRWFFPVRSGDVVESGVPEGPEEVLIGESYGDPHLITFDQVSYDFHAAGEFVLTREVNGPIEIHARQEPVSNTLSWNTAVATSLGDAEVMIDATDANPLQVDGEPLLLEDFDTAEVGDGLIGREGNTYTVVYAGEDGEVNAGDERLVVDVVGDRRLDLRVEVDADRNGEFEGLLSNANGVPEDDIATAEGTPLSRPLSFEDLYGEFREDWRIDSIEESLLDYDAGESPEGFFDPDFPSGITTIGDLDPDVRQQAEQAARNSGLEPGTTNFNNAVLDFGVTGDESFLESALDASAIDEESDNAVSVDPDFTPEQDPIGVNDDFVVLQHTSPSVLSAGVGDDTYIISQSTLNGDEELTLQDGQGSNSIQLVEGLEIARSMVAENALQLVLANGSVINVNGADIFSYDPGGNSVANIDNEDVAFNRFVSETLGVEVPTSGVVQGGSVTVGSAVGTISLPVGTSPLTVTATGEAETFTLDQQAAAATAANTQVGIEGFNSDSDALEINLPQAFESPGVSTLDDLNGVVVNNAGDQASVASNLVTNTTTVTLGPDADGDVIALELAGVTEPGMVELAIV